MAELHAQGPIGAPGGTSVVFTTPYPLPLGSQMKGSNGEVYVFLRPTAQVYSGLPVAILSDGTCSPIGVTHRGRIGVVCAEGTSVNGVWVQVYGRCDMQIGVAGTSPSDAANGPTTVQTSAATKFLLPTSATTLNVLAMVSDASSLDNRFIVRGIEVAIDPSISSGISGVTSATSHSGSAIGVFLNFPEVVYNGFNISS